MRGFRRSSRRLRLLVTLVVATGAASLAIALGATFRHPQPFGPAFAVVALATLCGDLTCIDLRVGRHVESYTWAELTLVLGLALLPPSQLVLTSLAVAISYFVSGRSALKLVFNTGSEAAGIGLAIVVTYAIATPSWDTPARSAVALIAGAVAYSAWNTASVVAAIAFSQECSVRAVYRKGASLRWFFCAGNIVLALIALSFLHFNPALLLVIPPCVGAALLAYRNYLHAIQERAIWRHLESMSQEINRLDESEIAEVAIARAVALLEADAVELRLFAARGESIEQVFVGTAAGVAQIGVPRARRHDDPIPTVSDAEACDAVDRAETRILVPLVAHEEQIGVLRVCFDAPVKLRDREHQVLRTYGHTITRSIENARLYAEMREQAARNKIAALHDPLTRLPNRVLLEARVRSLFESQEAIPGFAMLLIDLDHFKDVNDGLGHAAGDFVLCALGERLLRAVRPHDTVCRLGGDEFAVLLADDAPNTVAERLLAELAHPIEVNGVHVAVGGSIGIACAPDDGTTFEELLQHADIAMYDAKNNRGTFRRYRKGQDCSIIDRLNLVAELRTALHQDQFVLHYQPQFDLSTCETLGAEALVRWCHPTRGMLQPSEFVPLVESSSLLRDFTRCVLDKAVAECAQWQRSGRTLNVAVNLSARELDDERLPDDVLNVLHRHGLAPERLILEITETAILGDLDVVEEQMARLAKIGVTLSIDDFGTGHSSLAFLQRVMVHELKIDRSFVAGIVTNENDAAITRATVRLAHSLGLRTVAEGVEDTGVLDRLVDLRCDSAQGFLWSPPLPADEVRPVLGIEDERPVVLL